ncbi:PepSY domain-containing protein [Phenylobacterium sp.]|uniref:PepSY domain-containing protein n=1 Tax=Phenylobacterium sp. TaxID=1871053 RepID=UPI0025F13261|nr:PepSY domain-containing protein [Phenylobacterium sp.]
MRLLILFHRWVGVVLCLMFAAWFATGAMMVFVAFPALPGGDRATHSERIAPGQVTLTPREAAARLGDPSDLRLVGRAGQAAYLGTRQGHAIAVAATDGRVLAPLDATQAAQVASAFAHAHAASVSEPFDYDQWIVHQQFDPLRPFYRVRLASDDGLDLYVSARTGEVVQRTRRLERAANWVGSVIHWVYYVPLRRSFAAWDWTVWIGALVGLASVSAGLTLGVRATLKMQRSRRSSPSPFRGLMRWHHLLGLVAGLFVFAWIGSGWLSMDHARLFSSGEASRAAAAAYVGDDGPAATRLGLADVQTAARGATRVEFGRVAGCDVAASVGPGLQRSLAACPQGRQDGATLSPALITAALRSAWPQARIGPLSALRADSPYPKAEGLPDGVLRAKVDGAEPFSVFVHPASGKLLVVMDRSRAAYAWLYYMVHTYNYPGLSDRPALRITILLVPLALGFAFAVTGVLAGLRRLGSFTPHRQEGLADAAGEGLVGSPGRRV